EWRREDGRWVVSSFGDAMDYAGPRVIGRERLAGGVRDTVLSLPPVDAAGESWFVNNEPIFLEGRSFFKFGLTRPIDPALLARIGRYQRTVIYAEKGVAANDADILYIPVRPGEYQTYHAGHARMGPCGITPPRPRG
ncbi:MAG TPA: hypothetical protein VF771_11625, partial [Longimicrobiaceae bacterium]